MTKQNDVNEAPVHGIVPRCGYICSLYGVLVLDTDGCLLPHGHDGPHEFRNSRDGIRYQWEYDLENDEDVYWKKT